jgi:hypothetical protein
MLTRWRLIKFHTIVPTWQLKCGGGLTRHHVNLLTRSVYVLVSLRYMP